MPGHQCHGWPGPALQECSLTSPAPLIGCQSKGLIMGVKKGDCQRGCAGPTRKLADAELSTQQHTGIYGSFYVSNRRRNGFADLLCAPFHRGLLQRDLRGLSPTHLTLGRAGYMWGRTAPGTSKATEKMEDTPELPPSLRPVTSIS